MPLLCGLNGYICGLEDYHIMGLKIYGFVGELNDSDSFGKKLNINFTLLSLCHVLLLLCLYVLFPTFVQVRTGNVIV
jgi:hypothetical protein